MGKTYICPNDDIKKLSYNYQRILYSQEPFLVTRQNDPKKKEQDKNKNSLIPPPIGLPSKLSSQNLPTGGTGSDSDEDSFFKYPFRPPFVDQSGITMVLLPFLKLPPDWQHQLPGSQWYHWPMGEPDYDSGAILNIQLNGESIARLPIHSWELQELAEDLTNSQQLLQKLAYRLNGRETFIQQLLDILATAEQNPMDEESRGRIEKQLADVLEQPDHSFSLELEWFSLQAAMTPDNSIIIAHNGKGKEQEVNSGKVPGSSDQNQQGATGGEPSQSKQGKKETPDDRQNSNNPPPRRSRTGSHQKEANPGSELTITFVGRMNAGKSSLASALLGAKFFPSDERRTETREADIVVTPDTDVPSNTLRVRSLPGYGTEHTRIWLKNNPIAADEIVVFVFRNSLSGFDVDVLRWLTKQNIRQNRPLFNQIIFVRNRFDEVVEAEKNTRKQAEAMSNDEEARFVSGLQETLKAEFRGYMNKLFGKDKSFVCPELLFTDCRNIYECNGMEPLLKAIKSSVQQVYEEQGRAVIWAQFFAIREQISRQFIEYSGVFRQSFNREHSIAAGVLQEVRRLDPQVLNLQTDTLETYSSSLVEWFESEYQVNFDERVTRLRYLSTLAITSSEKIKKHADALLRKNEQHREEYLSDLHEAVNLNPEDLSDLKLEKELDLSASYQAEQYTKEFRKPILKAMRKHLWFWTSWVTSDEKLIRGFRGLLSRAIEAELQRARYQRISQKPANDLAKSSAATHSFDSEPLLSEQSLQDDLNEQIEELARQFTAILLSRIILPACYHLPLTVAMPEPASQPPLLEEPLNSRPPSRRRLPQPPMAKVFNSQPTALPEDTLEETAEKMPTVHDENSVVVTLPNGFQKQYTLDPPPFLTASELGAALAAFAAQTDRSQQQKSSLIVTRGGSQTTYWYIINPETRLTGTHSFRTSILIKDVSKKVSAPIEIWIDSGPDSVQVDKRTSGILEEVKSQSFAPKAWTYKGDAFPGSSLLITRAPLVNLVDLIVLQNSLKDETNRLLAGLGSSISQLRLSSPEVLELAIKLATLLKTLSEMQLSLSILDFDNIWVEPGSWQPHLVERRNLQHRPLGSEQSLPHWLSQQDYGLDAGTADETMESLTVKWLGQLFTLLSGRSPHFYQKDIVSRMTNPKDMSADHKRYLDAFDVQQLRGHVTDLLSQGGIKRSGPLFQYPEVSRRYTVQQNLLLLAQSMLDEKPKSRTTLDQIIARLREIQPTEPVNEL